MNGLGLAMVTHTRAPLEVIEGVSYVGDDLTASLERLRAQVGIRDATILSTCNRTEIYATFDGPADPSRLAWFLAQDRHICWGRIHNHVELHSDDEAVAHLFRVASGVDSLAFGEGEIVAQIKAVHAELKASSHYELLGLFEAAIRTSRAVRSRVAVSHAGASLGSAAVAAAGIARGSTSRVLVVGAGKIARSVLEALPGDIDLVVASRTLDSARSLAQGRGRAVPMSRFPGELAVADAVFFCASSRQPILDAVVASAITATRTSPLVAVDLGLPRNVGAEVRLVEGIEVVDLEGLRAHTDSSQRLRVLTEVEPIVAREVARYREAAIARSVAPLIEELRATLTSLAGDELDRVVPAEGPERARAEQVVRRVMGRLLHHAIAEVRTAATRGDLDTLSRLTRAFGAHTAPSVPTVVPQQTTEEEVA